MRDVLTLAVHQNMVDFAKAAISIAHHCPSAHHLQAEGHAFVEPVPARGNHAGPSHALVWRNSVPRLLGPVFDQIAQTMVDAFVSRAEALSSEP